MDDLDDDPEAGPRRDWLRLRGAFNHAEYESKCRYWRERFEANGNALYAWRAVLSALHARFDPTDIDLANLHPWPALPDWCLDYLGSVAAELHYAARESRDSKAFLERLPQLLGLSARGYSALRDLHRDMESDHLASVAGLAREDGLRGEAVLALLRDQAGIDDARTLQRKLTGKRRRRKRGGKPRP